MATDGRPLVYLTLGTVNNQAPLFQTVLAGLATLDVPVLVTLGNADPPRWDPSRTGSGSPAMSHSRPCCRTPRLSCPTAARAPCSPRSRTACPRCACRRAPTSSATATGWSEREPGSRLPPAVLTPESVADAVRALLDDPSYRAGAGRVCEEIAAMPSPDEVVTVLEALV